MPEEKKRSFPVEINICSLSGVMKAVPVVEYKEDGTVKAKFNLLQYKLGKSGENTTKHTMQYNVVVYGKKAEELDGKGGEYHKVQINNGRYIASSFKGAQGWVNYHFIQVDDNQGSIEVKGRRVDAED